MITVESRDQHVKHEKLKVKLECIAFENIQLKR
jgi:hypothetical protein